MSTSVAAHASRTANGPPSNNTSAHVSPTPVPATNGTHVPATFTGQEPRPPPAPPALTPNTNNSNKKAAGKAKKTLDSSETSKLLAQRISQLEHDAAGEKDQEAEIGACCPLPLKPPRILTICFEVIL